MMITKKLKAILSLCGFSFADFARKLRITPQALNKKKINDAYKISDLIEFGELTNTTLAFIDNETGKTVMEFNKDDLKDNS